MSPGTIGAPFSKVLSVAIGIRPWMLRDREYEAARSRRLGFEQVAEPGATDARFGRVLEFARQFESLAVAFVAFVEGDDQ